MVEDLSVARKLTIDFVWVYWFSSVEDRIWNLNCYLFPWFNKKINFVLPKFPAITLQDIKVMLTTSKSPGKKEIESKLKKIQVCWLTNIHHIYTLVSACFTDPVLFSALCVQLLSLKSLFQRFPLYFLCCRS